jgi:hypothetical protein
MLASISTCISYHREDCGDIHSGILELTEVDSLLSIVSLQQKFEKLKTL